MNPHPDSQAAVLSEHAMRKLGLHSQPFCERPAGHGYFFDPVMQMQLNMLQHNLKFSDMLQVLKGDAGSGKTALIIQMLRNASDEFQIFVARGKPALLAEQVITGMVKIFQQPVPGDIDACIDLLVKHLKVRLTKNLSSVLVLENAHEITVESLNQLFLYTDRLNEPLEGELRILLIADPSIESLLPDLKSRQISEGKLFVSNMRTLDRQRMQDYVEHRLRQAGYTGDIPLSSKQYNDLYKSTDGLPQQVDAVTASMLNQQADKQPLGDRLAALPLRLIAGIAACVFATGLLLFLFTGKPDESAGNRDDSQFTHVELAPTIIPEIDEATRGATTDEAGGVPIPNIPAAPDTATITLLSELESPPNNQFVESHGVVTPEPEATITTQNKADQTAAEVPQQTTQIEAKPFELKESEQWLLKQNPARFTVQLLATLDENELKRYARKHSVENKTALFRTLRGGRRWHVLSYGLYSSAETARAAIAKMPRELRRNAPWIRSIESVQDAINKARP